MTTKRDEELREILEELCDETYDDQDETESIDQALSQIQSLIPSEERIKKILLDTKMVEIVNEDMDGIHEIKIRVNECAHAISEEMKGRE